MASSALPGLGLDAGGSATRWALAGADGRVLASGEAGGLSGHLFLEAEQRRFDATVAEIAAAVGRPVGALTAGITGLDAATATAAEATRRLARTFALPETAVAVGDDMWIAFRAMFRPGEGHIVSSGSGSIGYHQRADGTVVRVGGRGLLIDDGGSAFWIAREGLRRLYHRIDEAPGAARATPLARALFEAVGGSSWDAVRSFVYGESRGRVAGLARAVASAAAADDAIALQVMRDAGAELARIALALEARGGRLPVAVIGRTPTLHPAILDETRRLLDGREVTAPAPDAAAAAARLAAEGRERPPPMGE